MEALETQISKHKEEHGKGLENLREKMQEKMERDFKEKEASFN